MVAFLSIILLQINSPSLRDLPSMSTSDILQFASTPEDDLAVTCRSRQQQQPLPRPPCQRHSRRSSPAAPRAPHGKPPRSCAGRPRRRSTCRRRPRRRPGPRTPGPCPSATQQVRAVFFLGVLCHPRTPFMHGSRHTDRVACGSISVSAVPGCVLERKITACCGTALCLRIGAP